MNGGNTGIDFHIDANDGFRLAATRYDAAAEVRGAVLVSSATAVPRQFYRHFATALSRGGYDVVTYDYRGIGGSRPPSLRGFDARTRDWVLEDMNGAIDYAGKTAGGKPLFIVGHSVGGQLAGMIDRPDAVAGMVTVSAQSGYWRLQGAEQKLVVAFHVYLTLPILAQLLGYVPWSWFSKAEDLPRGAAIEWSRWCRHPDYLLGDESLPLERYEDFNAPVLAYSVADDKWGTPASVDAMMRAYPNVERRHAEPGAHGIGKLGHFGFFRPAAEPLWDDVLRWLDDRSAAIRETSA